MLECESRIHLCGALTVRIMGERLEHDLPGRQGRLLFAFLASQQGRRLSCAGCPGFQSGGCHIPSQWWPYGRQGKRPERAYRLD